MVFFFQTKEAAIKALVELDDQGGKDEHSILNIVAEKVSDVTCTTSRVLGNR